MENSKANPEKLNVFTEVTLKKQLESIYQHLGVDASSKVEETLKKILKKKIINNITLETV